MLFWSNIEKCKQFFQSTKFGTSMGFPPRVSRPDKTNPPPGADFSISPSGFNYDMQSSPNFGVKPTPTPHRHGFKKHHPWTTMENDPSDNKKNLTPRLLWAMPLCAFGFVENLSFGCLRPSGVFFVAWHCQNKGLGREGTNRLD